LFCWTDFDLSQITSIDFGCGWFRETVDEKLLEYAETFNNCPHLEKLELNESILERPEFFDLLNDNVLSSLKELSIWEDDDTMTIDIFRKLTGRMSNLTKLSIEFRSLTSDEFEFDLYEIFRKNLQLRDLHLKKLNDSLQFDHQFAIKLAKHNKMLTKLDLVMFCNNGTLENMLNILLLDKTRSNKWEFLSICPETYEYPPAFYYDVENPNDKNLEILGIELSNSFFEQIFGFRKIKLEECSGVTDEILKIIALRNKHTLKKFEIFRCGESYTSVGLEPLASYML
jgi:hypothetical protein